VSAHLDPSAFVDASGDLRRVMLAHLQECATCREAVIDHDPSALFGLLAAAPIPTAVLEAVSSDVAQRAGTGRFSFGDVMTAAPSGGRFVAAAAAAGLALASFLATRVPVPDLAPALHANRADVDVHADRAVSKVVDFTVGETQVVMVYNGDLNL
jgi:hypothetical protein